MRVFIAIEFSNELKEYLYRVQQDLKKSIEKGNFSNIDNFHITLKFIGEASQDKISSIKQVIEKTTSNVTPFTLRTDLIGFFPKGNKKTLWMGIIKEESLLQKLFQDLEGDLERIGIEKDRKPFSPHITLLREAILKEDFKILEQNTKLESREIPIEKISLMESIRINGRLTYIPLYVCTMSKL